MVEPGGCPASGEKTRWHSGHREPANTVGRQHLLRAYEPLLRPGSGRSSAREKIGAPRPRSKGGGENGRGARSSLLWASPGACLRTLRVSGPAVPPFRCTNGTWSRFRASTASISRQGHKLTPRKGNRGGNPCPGSPACPNRAHAVTEHRPILRAPGEIFEPQFASGPQGNLIRPLRSVRRFSRRSTAEHLQAASTLRRTMPRRRSTPGSRGTSASQNAAHSLERRHGVRPPRSQRARG